MGKKSFAVELKSSRNALGLSQEKFAKKLGVSSLSVCMWENGKYEPKEGTMVKVRAAMAKLGTAKVSAPVKAPAKKKATKAKAPVKAKVQKVQKAPVKAKATVKKATKTKAPVLRVADVLAVITEIRTSLQELDQKFDALKSPTTTSSVPLTTSIVDVEPVGAAVPEVEVVFRQLLEDIKNSKKDGMCRGKTMHIVEWPEICNTYYKALDILGIEK